MSDYNVSRVSSISATEDIKISGISTFSGKKGIIIPTGAISERYIGISTEPIVKTGLTFYLDPQNSNANLYDANDFYTVYNLADPKTYGEKKGGVGYASSTGGVFVFDGSNDEIITNFSAGTVKNLTVCWWLKLDAYNNNGNGIHFGSNATSTSQCYIGPGTSGGDSIDWRFYTGTFLDESAYFTSSLDWQYLVGVYDQDTGQGRMRLYVNSILQDTALSNNRTAIDLSLDTVNIMGRFTPNSKGLCGPIMIYNRSLTQEEITQNYDAQRYRFGI